MATPMSERVCGKCGTKGHRKDHCPEAAEAAPAPRRKRPPGGGTRSKKKRRTQAPAPEPAAVAEGNGREPTRATIDGAKQLLVAKLTE